jgi:hypothetical protein
LTSEEQRAAKRESRSDTSVASPSWVCACQTVVLRTADGAAGGTVEHTAAVSDTSVRGILRRPCPTTPPASAYALLFADAVAGSVCPSVARSRSRLQSAPSRLRATFAAGVTSPPRRVLSQLNLPPSMKATLWQTGAEHAAARAEQLGEIARAEVAVVVLSV